MPLPYTFTTLNLSVYPKDAQGNYIVPASALDNNFTYVLARVHVGTVGPTDTDKYPFWLDTSTSPATLKIWNGSEWVSPNVDNADNADKVDTFHASVTPTANQIPVLNQNAILNLPNTTAIITNTYTFRRINGDNLTTDYPLGVNEEAVYSWNTNSSLSKALYIACPTGGGVFQMIIIAPYQVASDITTTLSPNNTSYTDAIIFTNIRLKDGDTAVSLGTSTLSNISFHFASSGGITETIISTFANSKFAMFTQRVSRYTGGGLLVYGGNRWRDTTTAWTSLGTLDTSAANGTITVLVRRLL